MGTELPGLVGRLQPAEPACGGHLRREPCWSPATPNGRCRMHAGKSIGPRTAEGIERLRQAHTIHGGRSAEMIKLRRHFPLITDNVNARLCVRAGMRWSRTRPMPLSFCHPRHGQPQRRPGGQASSTQGSSEPPLI
jgi:hypothetical protein